MSIMGVFKLWQTRMAEEFKASGYTKLQDKYAFIERITGARQRLNNMTISDMQACCDALREERTA